MSEVSTQILCRLHDIPDGTTRGFLPDGHHHQVFAVRRGDQMRVYLNSCPHYRTPLELKKDKFLAPDGQTIMCYGHGARFSIETGECIDGVCRGRFLTHVPAIVSGDKVLIPSKLPALTNS